MQQNPQDNHHCIQNAVATPKQKKKFPSNSATVFFWEKIFSLRTSPHLNKTTKKPQKSKTDEKNIKPTLIP